MRKKNWIFGTIVGLISLFLVFSVFILGNMGAVFGQAVPKKEICNGVDDNENGVIDEGVNCDHYLSYLVDKSIHPISVVLSDQFISPTDFQLVLIERILNPVKKIHAGITFDPKRPDLHYLAYRLQSPAPFAQRSVFIENQFERRNILVTKPRYLLTPTGKRKVGIPIETLLSAVPPSVADRLLERIVPPLPQNANHYLCYDIEPYTIAKGASLKDQFQLRLYEIIRARYLCNPVKKTHDGKVHEIIDQKNHLICYEVIPHNQVNRQVITHDQFGVKSLKALRTEEICVPTIKTLLPSGCTRPDDHGTAVVFDAGAEYHNTGGQLTIVQPIPPGEGLMADVILRSGPDTIITRSGSPELGEVYLFDTEILQLTLSGSGRVLNIPVSGEMRTDPRTPGNPMQSFDTDMRRLQGQLPPGDPDFDLLRITAGADVGLPSPGHSTLTMLPGGNWAIDSFFDITYRVDFVGTPGGPLAGQSGSNVGTVRLVDMCPTPSPTPIVIPSIH